MVVLEKPLAQRPPRARPGHHARGRPGRDGALQQRRERAGGVGRGVRPVRRRRSASPASADDVFGVLLRAALAGDADGGGLLAYNYLSGEPITGLAEGRPLFVRTPDSRLTLANFVRAQVYGAFGTLSLGMRVLAAEGVELDSMYAHGGMFRTAGVAQRLLAAAVGAPVTVGQTAGEGGAWGIAVLAAYLEAAADQDLSTYLARRVFGGVGRRRRSRRTPTTCAGSTTFLERYSAGLADRACRGGGGLGR